MSFSKRSSGGVVDAACPLDWSHPLDTGLVGEWSVVPNSGWRGGLTFRDLVRGGRKPNDGTLTNSPTWVGPKGRPGGYGCISVTGGSHVLAPVFTLSALTVACWVQPGVTGRGDLVTCWTGGTTNSAWNLLYGVTTGKPQFFVSNGSSAPGTTTGATAMAVGTWYFLTGTYDGTTSRCYLNGVQQGTATPGPINTTSLTNLRIGRNGNTDGNSTAVMDSVSIYNRALTAAEVCALYLEYRRYNPERWRWIGRRTWYNIPVSSGLTADASITLDALTIAAAASHPVTADSSITLGAVTLSSAASHPDTADANITLGAVTVSSAATHPDTADANILLGDVTVASAVTHPNTADASIPLGALTITSTGSHPGLSTGTGINPLKVWGD